MKKGIVLSVSTILTMTMSPIVLAQETTGQYILENSVIWPGQNQEVTTVAQPPLSNDMHLNERQEIAIKELLQRLSSDNQHTTSVYVQVGKNIISSEAQATPVLPADSMIKLFILVAFYHAVQEKELQPTDVHTLVASDIVEGAGALQNLPQNQPYDYQTMAQLMIQANDQTATNILIEALGGIEKVNQRIQQLGFIQTELQASMGQATTKNNKTSASDVANLLYALYEHVLLEEPYNDQALGMLSQHGPVGLAETLPAGGLIYGKLGEQVEADTKHDALLYEIAHRTPVIVVILSNQESLDFTTIGREMNRILQAEGTE